MSHSDSEQPSLGTPGLYNEGISLVKRAMMRFVQVEICLYATLYHD